MRNPFKRRKETRDIPDFLTPIHASTGLGFDASEQLRLNQFSTNPKFAAAARKTATYVTCVSLIADALSQVKIESDSDDTQAVTPDLISIIARDLITSGNAVIFMEPNETRIHMTPTSTNRVRGETSDPAEWRYEIMFSTPSKTHGKRMAEASEILHFRVNCLSNAPHVGRAALSLASASAAIAAGAEIGLAGETKLPSFAALITSRDAGIDPTDEPLESGNLRTFARILGGFGIIPSLNRDGSLLSDFEFSRVRPEPVSTMIDLRRQMSQSIASLLHVPSELIGESSSPAGAREAYRRFVTLCIDPYAREIQRELRMKLDASTVVSTEHLMTADITAHSRAYSQLVNAGMDAQSAMNLVGFATNDTR